MNDSSVSSVIPIERRKKLSNKISGDMFVT